MRRNMLLEAVGVMLAAAAPNLGATFTNAPPPGVTITNAIDGDDLYNVTLGAPGSCSCEQPRCESGSRGTRLMNGGSLSYGPAGGCDYYAVGGGITSSSDGQVCNTWRADYKSCAVYPGSTSGDCARVVASCSRAGTTTTLHATIDRKCDTLPWKTCNDTSACCGVNECRLVNPGVSKQKLCQPK